MRYLQGSSRYSLKVEKGDAMENGHYAGNKNKITKFVRMMKKLSALKFDMLFFGKK